MISNSGAVSRPAYAGGDADVTVTAAINCNGTIDTKDFSLKVLKLAQVTCTVTFDKNGGNTEANPITKVAVSGGNVGTLPAAPARTDYTFAGWNTAPNGSGDTFTAATAVTSDMTVYAQWTSNTPTFTDAGSGLTFKVLTEDTGSKSGTVMVAQDNYTETAYTIPETVTTNGGFTYTVTTIGNSVFSNCTIWLRSAYQ